MTPRVRGALAGLGIIAGALAAAAGNPQPAVADDEITAIDLAQRLRDGQSDLLVLDARNARILADASVEVLPGAQPLAATDAAAIGADTLVIVYGEDDIDRAPVDAWRGSSQIHYRLLRGGLRAWNDEILFPTVRSDASARGQQAFAARAALSRYFGGSPRRVEPGEIVARNRSRRGC
jgi:hypothetical protein